MKKHPGYIVLVAMLAMAPIDAASAQAAQPSADDARRIERFTADLTRLRSQLHMPGLSAAIVRDQVVIWSAGFGFADVARHTPATPATPYEIASISKPFASVLLMQLVERGQLDLDTPMSKWSSDYKSDSVTVRQVFSHTSEGIPGSHYDYNGNLFDNLTDVVKTASGKRYRAVLSREIIEKIGLMSTSPGTDLAEDQPSMRELLGAEPLARYAAAVRTMAKPYRLYGDSEVVQTRQTTFGISTAFGVVSTVLDLAKFDAALDRGQLLSPATRRIAWTPTTLNDGRTIPYGLGWFVQSVGAEQLIWHNGLWPDLYSALLLKVPARNLTLILLANSDALSAPFKLAQGDVTTSAFACAFLGAFVPSTGTANQCAERSSALAASWLAHKRQNARTEIRLNPLALEQFVGRYAAPSGTVVTIARNGDRLVRQLDSGELELFAASPTDFFAKAVDVLYAFDGGSRVRVVRDGQETVLTRLP